MEDFKLDEFTVIYLCGVPDEMTYAVVMVPKADADNAYKALDEAYEQYWNEEHPNYYCWGWADYIEDELNKANIPHSVVYDTDFQHLLFENYKVYANELDTNSLFIRYAKFVQEKIGDHNCYIKC